MLNQIVLVGRIARELEVIEVNDKKKYIMTLAVARSPEKIEGEIDTDFISVVMYDSLASNVNEYCKKGDIVGVKGRISKLEGEELDLVAEKVTFLSTKKSEEGENE